ncbi:MAG TPA: phenylalanine--tRNA ligase subunit beta [Burkholderiaceae bacterium]|nr:phenylalanine--tRNA ligase subunit beta [Burkholderiaceae bacterium]
MQFSESWLRSFVNPPISTDELSHQLTMAGLEVEEVRDAAPPFSGVVVAQVMAVNPHPNADKLRVCSVDVGTVAPLQIVCGAPNVSVGMKVPCALVGAQLPPGEDGKPFGITLNKLRGVESHGMLCSARELGLSQDHAGLLSLSPDAPVGKDFRVYAELDDKVFIVKLTPDKGHCLSILGIAREVSAITGAPLVVPPMPSVEVSIDDRLPVAINANDLCGRFAGRVIRHVNARAATPQWMKDRLERAGQRSISALVDISNYVMLELGRPSHVFDLDRIHGGLNVRWAKRGETLTLLNGQTVELDETVGVIADERQVESMAGIMGGESTAVSLDTQHVYLEAAFWWPDSIRGRARRYNFSTDAAHRFERGVDPANIAQHVDFITRLILDICGGKAGPIDDQQPNMPTRAPVTMRISRAARVIGIALDASTCEDVFRRLDFQFERSGDVVTVTPPSYRFDIEIEEDLIEEVARIHGYDAIPVRPSHSPQRMRIEREGERSLHALRPLLVDRGYQETVNYSFVDERWERALAANENPIRLLNPIASHMSVMRSTLLGGLIEVAHRNFNRRIERVRVFEIGRVFMRYANVMNQLSDVAGVAQPMRIAALASGAAWPDQWGMPSRPIDFFDVKADVEALCWGCGEMRVEAAVHPALHPGRSARVLLDGKAIGWLGELHPRVLQEHELPGPVVVFELDAEPLRQQRMPQPTETPRFPSVKRDLAFVFDASVAAQRASDVLTCAARQAAPGLVREITLFDEYRGKGLLLNEKSLAFRMVLQDTRSTLQDDFVDGVQQAIVEVMKRELGARLR